MDYSLLVGIHDCTRADQDLTGDLGDGEGGGGDSDSDSGSGLGPGFGGATPPDSPLQRETSLQYDGIVPQLDIYAIPSSLSN